MQRPQRILTWEGSLIDPVGAILSALAFHAVTASTRPRVGAQAGKLSAGLAAEGTPGAARILPVTFLVIVVTVCLYGLTATPVARWLDVVRSARARPLLVGDDDWTVHLGRALQAAGLDVVLWAGAEEQRERIRDAGLELAPGELLAAATGRGAQLEGITAVLLLTGDDDFNALASTVLRPSVEGPVYRLRPARHDTGVVAPFIAGPALFPPSLTQPVIAERSAAGARFELRAREDVGEGEDVLFVVRSDGRAVPTGDDGAPVGEPGDRVVVLGPGMPVPRTAVDDRSARTAPSSAAGTLPGPRADEAYGDPAPQAGPGVD